jgi:hypothetical protein
LKKRTGISGFAMLLLVGSTVVAAPASAAPSSANTPALHADAIGWDPLESVEKLGNLATAATPIKTKESSSVLKDALAGGAPGPVASEPSITPVPENGAQPVAKDSNGHPVTVYSASNYGFVVGKNITGSTAGFVSIKDATAPSSYKFSVGNSAKPSTLELQQDGSIWVRDASNNVIKSHGDLKPNTSARRGAPNSCP